MYLIGKLTTNSRMLDQSTVTTVVCVAANPLVLAHRGLT